MPRLLKPLSLVVVTVALLMAQTTTKVDYGTQLKNIPLFSDATPVANTLPQFCTAAGTVPLAITKNWTGQHTQTLTCSLQGAGGIIQPSAPILTVQQVITLPCPNSVPFPMFNTSLGGAGSISFSKGCAQPLDIRMFVAPGGDYGIALQAAYAALANIGGGQICYPAGTFAHATKFTLTAGIPIEICGAGAGSFPSSSVVSPTLLTYSGSGAWFNQASADQTDNVRLHDFSFSCSTAGCQPMQVGSFGGPIVIRANWEIRNLYLFGPSGSTPAANPGLALTSLVKCNIANVIVINFYQPMIMDRTNGCQRSSVWFQNYTIGPSVTQQAGAGAAAAYGAELVDINVAYQGPNYGSGNCPVTYDQFGITTYGNLLEPTVSAAAYECVTVNGSSLSETGLELSGSVTPTYPFVWADLISNVHYIAPVYLPFASLGTPCIGTPPGCSGTTTRSQGPITFTAAPIPFNQMCQTVSTQDCQTNTAATIRFSQMSSAGSVGTFTFPLPANYTNFYITISGRGSSNSSNLIYVVLNGDGAAHYNWNEVFNNSDTTAAATFGYSASFINAGCSNPANAPAGEWGSSTIRVNNYSLATGTKVVMGTCYQLSGSVTGKKREFGGSWNNGGTPAAITSISVTQDTGNFSSGTTATLYVEQ